MISCKSCGNQLLFDIKSQKMVCRYCGNKMDPEETESTGAETSEYFETTIFTCPTCGGEITALSEDIASFCSYCGNTQVLDSRITKEKRPEYIVPFKVSKEQCIEAFGKKIAHNLFVSKTYKDMSKVDSFRGIYMPYEVYMPTVDEDVAVSLEHTDNGRTYEHIDEYKVEGHLRAKMIGSEHDKSLAFDDDVSERISPYTFVESGNSTLKPFKEGYFSGFYADMATEEMGICADTVAANTKTALKNALDTRFRGTDATLGQYEVDNKGKKLPKKRRIVNTKPAFKANPTIDNSNVSLTMLPVWFMSYRNKDRVAYAAINGQTGRISMDLPMDTNKFFIVSGIISILFYLLYTFVLDLTFKPDEILYPFALCLSFANLLYVTEALSICKKDNISLQKQRKPKKKLNPRTKILIAVLLFFCFPIIMFVAMSIVAIFIASPISFSLGLNFFLLFARKKIKLSPFIKGVNCILMNMIIPIVFLVTQMLKIPFDELYYGIAFVSVAAICYTLYCLIVNYNVLATRKPRQFEKKGGFDSVRTEY